MRHQEEGHGLLKGVIVGSVIGGAAGLLLAPKAGRQIRQAITEGVTNSLSSITDHFESNGSNREEGNHEMLKGAALGAIICGIAAFLLAPQVTKKLKEELGDKYEDIYDAAEGFLKNVNNRGHKAIDQLEEWKDILGTIVQKLSHSKKRHGINNLDKLLDWATIGVQLFQHIKRR